MPPALAHLAGLLPLRTIGVESFRQRHPTYDGRGTLIAILDGGIDPGLPGMRSTTTGDRKLVDLRDFSGEGRVALVPLTPAGDSVRVGEIAVAGFGRVARLATGPYYGGVFSETALGTGIEADANGDGDATSQFPFVVTRASDGWIMVTDTDGDGSLDNERPVHDYAHGASVFSYGTATMTFAANFTDSAGRPLLDLFFDNSSHGTHVAGIAAGHDLFGVDGFDGVAPGAQVLGLKIANNAWGKISASGSMLRAMQYAADYAASRRMPLIINLSYGVGNEVEGSATIDSLLDGFARRHPDVLVVVSAGNDGPGVSTVGFPASADMVLTSCALVPGVFARAPQPGVAPAPDVLGWWSARGGEVAKPDLCAPGIAFSNVPPWRTGEEIASGTSQAAPQVAGAAAILQSAGVQEGRVARAIDLKRALTATATPLPEATVVDQGAGVPNVEAAYEWLVASHQAGVYVVRSLPDGGNTSHASGAYRRNGLAGSGDTLQRFVVTTVGGQPAARLLLSSDADWLAAPPRLELAGEPGEISVRYDATKLSSPGMYVGSVWARAASDTLAGPAFRLTNTVIVPQQILQPYTQRAVLGAGQVDRYFFSVPPEAGGLRLSIRVTGGRGTMLYLFEPSGRPYLDAGSLEVTFGDTTTALVVPGEDLVPGVYEGVVVAPPASSITYRLTAELPSVAVRAIGTGPSAVLLNRTGDTCRVAVTARVTGAVREYRVGGGPGPLTLDVETPAWASQAILDLTVPTDVWNRVTDFGIRVRGAGGRETTERPLDYSKGRRVVVLDSLERGQRFTIRFLPAFARASDAAALNLAVRVAFPRPDVRPLAILGMADGADLTINPHQTLGLQFSPVPPDLGDPPGYAPLVDVTVEPHAGLAASREGAIPSSGPTP